MKITLNNPKFPRSLKQLSNPPNFLYVNGNILRSDEKSIAIIGTRKPSKHGIEVTKLFTKHLVKNGFTIISGLARGIDTVAHKQALISKGRTIAILGSGIDYIYPPENRLLADKISKNGAILSTFPPAMPPLGKNFLARNAIIAAMSKAVLVIEGRRKSGTLNTASHAARMGKDVFAVPGTPGAPQSEATEYLITNGCMVAAHPKDILDSLE